VRLREFFITGLRSVEQFPSSVVMEQQYLLYGQQFFLYLSRYLCHVKPHNGIKLNLQHIILTQTGTTTLNFVSCHLVTATTLRTSSSRRWTSFNGWQFWPSQRHLSISLDPGCRLSSF